MKKLFTIAVVVLIAVAMVQAPAFAASPWTQETTYTAKIGNKLGFGVKNLVLGWTEIFARPDAYANEDKNFVEGVGMGLWNAIVYTVGGALHTATFPIPVDIPLPNNGIESNLLS